MLTLSIDTSNKTMAIAVVDNQSLLGSMTTAVKKNHSELLMISIENLMDSIDRTPSDLNRIVVAMGPGSYTGLRIGVTAAKTLAWTLSIPLIGVSSLESLAFNLDGNAASNSLIVPLFNARRQNVYSGVYQSNHGDFLCIKEDQHVGIKELLETLKKIERPIVFIGEDVALFEDEICSALPSASIINDDRLNQPNGLSLSLIADRKLSVDDIYHFIPNYLKRVEAEEQWLDKTDQREDGWQNHLISFEGF